MQYGLLDALVQNSININKRLVEEIFYLYSHKTHHFAEFLLLVSRSSVTSGLDGAEGSLLM